MRVSHVRRADGTTVGDLRLSSCDFTGATEGAGPLGDRESAHVKPLGERRA
jgi:hypothetical protein